MLIWLTSRLVMRAMLISALLTLAALLAAQIMGEWKVLAFIMVKDGQSSLAVMDVKQRLMKSLDGTLDVDNFAVSPDGQQLAFVTSEIVNGEPIGPRRTVSKIFIMERMGRDRRQVLLFQGTVSGMPVWSPDGKQLAYTANRDTQNDIYVVDIVSGTDRRLTTQGVTSKAVWSPDSQQIQFVSLERDVYRINADGKSPQKLAPEARDEDRGVWASNSQHIFTMVNSSRGADIYVADRSGGDKRLVTAQPIPNMIFFPYWSPDGQQMAFLNSFTNEYDIYTMREDGSDLRRVVTDHHSIVEPIMWSPDSRQIAYTIDLSGRGSYSIMMVNVDGSGEQILTPDFANSFAPVFVRR